MTDKPLAIPQTAALEQHSEAMQVRHHASVRGHLEDMPEVRDWTRPEKTR
jgi:hypothetical protein